MAEGYAQVFKSLHILQRSAIEVKNSWAGADVGLVRTQRQPFRNRVSMESRLTDLSSWDHR